MSCVAYAFPECFADDTKDSDVHSRVVQRLPNDIVHNVVAAAAAAAYAAYECPCERNSPHSTEDVRKRQNLHRHGVSADVAAEHSSGGPGGHSRPRTTVPNCYVAVLLLQIEDWWRNQWQQPMAIRMSHLCVNLMAMREKKVLERLNIENLHCPTMNTYFLFY